MVAIFMSAMAGVFGVAQAGINKVIGDSWGFSAALLLNGLVFLVCNVILYAAVHFYPKYFSSPYLISGTLAQFRWWWVFPGIMGFFLVMGLAYSVMSVGATQTFIISVSAQLVFGVIWDLAVEGRAVATTRLAGAGLALVGTLLATR
jgi:uncharacterized membrane protein YdcZ (DUF606 family)